MGSEKLSENSISIDRTTNNSLAMSCPCEAYRIEACVLVGAPVQTQWILKIINTSTVWSNQYTCIDQSLSYEDDI